MTPKAARDLLEGVGKGISSVVFGIVYLVIVQYASAVEKPTGIFSSSGAMNAGIYGNPNLKGVLIRVTWSQIEAEKGVFDFSLIETQVAEVESHGLDWSLAVIGGGVGSPDWLIDDLNVPYVDYTFRGEAGYRLPLFWDEQSQMRITMLSEELGKTFADNEGLKLVYVTQMTSNGIEGHLQGVSISQIREAGFNEDVWVKASLAAVRSFAQSFPNKAIAIEVHEIDGSSDVPIRIMQELQSDELLASQVGIAMWWISGKTSYQGDLIEALKLYPGDLYGQVIGRSDQAERFGNGDYGSVFTQAKELGMRYLEPWEFEFLYGNFGANGKCDETFADFNEWAAEQFLPSIETFPDLESLEFTFEEGELQMSWDAKSGFTYKLYRWIEYVSKEWELIEETSSDSGPTVWHLPTGFPDDTSVLYRLGRE